MIWDAKTYLLVMLTQNIKFNHKSLKTKDRVHDNELKVMAK